jgi:hypothetical protein
MNTLTNRHAGPVERCDQVALEADGSLFSGPSDSHATRLEDVRAQSPSSVVLPNPEYTRG